jgi:hypothetical protein
LELGDEMRDSLIFDVRRFVSFPVSVETSSGLVSGVLKYVDPGGRLLLKTPGSWSLIKEWIAIKRR